MVKKGEKNFEQHGKIRKGKPCVAWRI